MNTLRFSCLLLLGLLLSAGAQAHRFAPSLLKVNEIGEGQYHLVWKTPAQGTSNIPLSPSWPQTCWWATAAATGARTTPRWDWSATA